MSTCRPSSRSRFTGSSIKTMRSSTTFHLSAKQEALHAFLLDISEQHALGLPTSKPPPVSIFTYPLVSVWPPFPFEAGPPIDHASGKIRTIAPHLRSANNLSYTRTLTLLRRELGPHFPLEKLWERHTYFVSSVVLFPPRGGSAESSSRFRAGIRGTGCHEYFILSVHPAYQDLTWRTLFDRDDGYHGMSLLLRSPALGAWTAPS